MVSRGICGFVMGLVGYGSYDIKSRKCFLVKGGREV